MNCASSIERTLLDGWETTNAQPMFYEGLPQHFPIVHHTRFTLDSDQIRPIDQRRFLSIGRK